MYVVDPIAQGVGTMGANPEVAIADVCALALRIDVTQDQKKISMFEAGAKKQLRGYGADDIEVGRESPAGEKQDI